MKKRQLFQLIWFGNTEVKTPWMSLKDVKKQIDRLSMSDRYTPGSFINFQILTCDVINTSKGLPVLHTANDRIYANGHVHIVTKVKIQKVKNYKWTLVGQGADKWFGNGEQIFANSRDELREAFRDSVEGDWSNGCYDADGQPESKEDAIARLWIEFFDLADEVEVE